MKKKLLAVLLAGCLAVPTASFAVNAETTDSAAAELNPYDLSLTLGSNTYTFPMTLEDAQAAGLNIPDVEVKDGYYYDVDVDNGRSAFEVRLELIDNVVWLVGYEISMESTPDAIAAGIQWNDLTAAELQETYQNRTDYTYASIDSSSIHVSFFHNEYDWRIYLNEDGTIDTVGVQSEIPYDFGVVESELAGQTDPDLPDVSTMDFTSFILDGKYYDRNSTVQDLLDNGWVFEKTVSVSDEITHNYGIRETMYNGVGMVRIEAYNTGSDTVTVADCLIDTVTVLNTDQTSLIFADGLSFQSSLEEFEAVFGTPESDTEEYDYYTATEYEYEVLNGTSYIVEVCDGTILSLSIEDIQ